MFDLDHLVQDLRHAGRNLLKYPVSCAVAVISLALGIGATAATLTIRDVVFSKPPGLYRNPIELSRVQVGSPDRPIRGGAGSPVPGPLYEIWRAADVGGAVAAASAATSRQVRAADRTDTMRVRAVSPEFFAVLGVDAALGRTFSASPQPEAYAPAVLSDRVWRTLLDSRAEAIGATIWISDAPYTVVGVMPKRFWFSSMDSPIWTVLDHSATATAETRVEVVVRRAAGVTPERLGDRLQPGLREYASRLPAAERQQYLRISAVRGTPIGDQVMIALPWLLGVAVLLTLLIACANVAILVIAQWTAREHEIAIRASLGAGRGRIVRALLCESVLIAAAGGAIGIAAATAIRGLIVRNAGPNIQFFDLTFNPVILIESMLITLAAGLVCGIGPALFETRRLHGNPMRALASSDRVRQRWRNALVVLEIGVTVALLVVTGGMLNTYQRNLATDVGFRTAPLVVLRVANDRGVPADRVLDVLRQMPGVVRAARSTTVPYLAFGPLEPVAADRTDVPPVRAERGAIDPDFFAALDVPLRAGRSFSAADGPGARIAIVNETLASRLFAAGNPIGRTVLLRGVGYEIVGVVADYRNTGLQNHVFDPKLFLPLDAERSANRAEFLIRTSGDPAALVRALRTAIPAAAAGNAIAHAAVVDQTIVVGGQEILVGTAPLVPLISTGMLLTAAGIYGVLAFAIARRSRELAVRVAIGATRRDVLQLVASQSVRLVAIGTICGVGGTFALSRIVRAAGGQGSFLDPDWVAFAVPVAIIAAIGVLATWAPSRKAMRIDPAVLLRTT